MGIQDKIYSEEKIPSYFANQQEFSNFLIKDSIIYASHNYTVDGDNAHDLDTLYLLNANTGKEIKHMGESMLPFYANNGITVGRSDIILGAYNTKTNKLLWNINSLFVGDMVKEGPPLYDCIGFLKDKLILKEYYSPNNGYYSSIFVVLVDYKTGKALKKVCVGGTGMHWYNDDERVTDSVSFFNVSGLITNYDLSTFKERWKTSYYRLGDEGNGWTESLIGIISDTRQVFIVTRNSEIKCVDEITGKTIWVKNFGHMTDWPQNNFQLLANYAILNRFDTSHNIRAFVSTLVIDRNNPDNTATDGSMFFVLDEDIKNNMVYIFDHKTKSLLKCFIPGH